MDPSKVNYVAALVAALSTFVMGGLWYSPLLFAKPWQRLSKLSDEELKNGNMGALFGSAFVLALVSATNLAFFLADGRPNIVWGMIAGSLAGVGWVVPSLATTYLFGRKPFKLILIDCGYHVVSFVVMGAILGVWKK